jgi:hypothetical protein
VRELGVQAAQRRGRERVELRVTLKKLSAVSRRTVNPQFALVERLDRGVSDLAPTT